jgi:hypothetical protein
LYGFSEDGMSYLQLLRLHFAGVFIAAPSTVNNIRENFDSEHFDPANGLWNPKGTGAFGFEQCRVTAAQYGDGTRASAGSDTVLDALITDSGRPTAKIVDLDPDQQMVSMLFGLRVGLAKPTGGPLVSGTFTPAPFTDLWFRAGERADGAMGVFYQSWLESLSWGDVSSSRWLGELRAAAGDGILSIRFNLDSYSMQTGPKFTKGRVTGTLSAATRDEPKHFLVGRHLAPLSAEGNFAVAVVNESARKIHLDLGNALPTKITPGSPLPLPLADIGAIALAVADANGKLMKLDDIDYRSADFYTSSAGIVDLPAARPLTDAEFAAVAAGPLIVAKSSGTTLRPLLAESADGKHVRADLFVARLNPGDPFAVEFRAAQFGKPLAGETIVLGFQARGPGSNEPASALTLPASVTIDAQGKAEATLTSADPGNPRKIIDGQVYFVDYALSGIGSRNQNDFLSVLVWDAYTPEDPPTWNGSMRAIFTQYANLYPFMKRFFDMSSYDELSDNANSIVKTLQLPITNAHYMPVTRDLCDAKRNTMIRWLTSPGADGKPLLGAVAAPQIMAAAVVVAGGSKTEALRAATAARSRKG